MVEAVHYNMVLGIMQFKDEPPNVVSKQKCVDYIKENERLWSFVYIIINVYIFVWIQHGCYTNTVFALSPVIMLQRGFSVLFLP